MTDVLFVAAGGGGDAIAAAVLAAADVPGRAAVATLSWDRLVVDPLPGPRSASDFTGLVIHAPGSVEVVANTAPVPPAGSLLPRLAVELGPRLFLLDPSHGVPALGRQLRAIADTVGASRLAVVDVGGDLVADGSEEGLRSPLADALTLSACLASGLPATGFVCGPGLDGELTEAQVLDRCSELNGRPHRTLTAEQVAPFRSVLHWHPSEATGLLIAAARGRRGIVEVRDAGSRVVLSSASCQVLSIPSGSLARANPYSERLMAATSLDEANEILRGILGRSTELDYERRKALALRAASAESHFRGAVSAEEIDATADAVRARGADYVTIRRLSELFRPTVVNPDDVRQLLRAHDPSRVDPPLWDVRRES
jgi:hypothetical protein